MFNFSYDKRVLYIIIAILVAISLTNLMTNPGELLSILYGLPGVLIAITFHEFAHGFAAYKLGDNTAKMEGRLSLNPFAHLDPIGTLMLVFLGIGWGKPVHVNPRNYTRKISMEKGEAIVSLAGPLTNIILAFVFAIISQIPFYLFIHKFFGGSGLNIFFTLFLGLTSILLYDKIKKKVKSKNKIINVLAILPAIILSIIGQLLDVDYGWWGVILIFVFFVFKDNKIKTVIAFLILCIIKYSIEIILNGFSYLYIQLMLWTMLPIALIVLYNGEQGRKIKYLSYAFYPIHLLLLYFLF